MKWRVLAVIGIVTLTVVCWTAARITGQPSHDMAVGPFDPVDFSSNRLEMNESAGVDLHPAAGQTRPDAWWDTPIGTRPAVRIPPRPRVRSPWRPPPR